MSKVLLVAICIWLALISALAVFIIFPVHEQQTAKSVAAPKSDQEVVPAQPPLPKAVQSDHDLRFQIDLHNPTPGLWEPKVDEVAKRVMLTIPLKDGTGQFAGLFLIGCDAVHVFFRIKVDDEYHLFDQDQIVPVEFSFVKLKETYPFDATIAKKVLDVSGYPGLNDPGINEALHVREWLFRRLHRDKNFDLAIGNKGSWTSPERSSGTWKPAAILSVREPSSLPLDYTKMFEQVAAYCININLQ